jgi:hypothetical protein
VERAHNAALQDRKERLGRLDAGAIRVPVVFARAVYDGRAGREVLPERQSRQAVVGVERRALVGDKQIGTVRRVSVSPQSPQHGWIRHLRHLAFCRLYAEAGAPGRASCPAGVITASRQGRGFLEQIWAAGTQPCPRTGKKPETAPCLPRGLPVVGRKTEGGKDGGTNLPRSDEGARGISNFVVFLYLFSADSWFGNPGGCTISSQGANSIKSRLSCPKVCQIIPLLGAFLVRYGTNFSSPGLPNHESAGHCPLSFRK